MKIKKIINQNKILIKIKNYNEIMMLKNNRKGQAKNYRVFKEHETRQKA